MKKQMRRLLLILAAIFVLLGSYIYTGLSNEQEIAASDKLRVVATTTFLGDLVTQIAGDKVELDTLMGSGMDPHQFQASSSDLNTLLHADIIFYGGLHLEAKLADIFDKMDTSAVMTIDTSRSLPREKLHGWQDDGAPDQVYDPHIWFDIDLWKLVAEDVLQTLCSEDPQNQEYYKIRYANYVKELDVLALYTRERISEIPKEQRFLVTAHDAFNYFGSYTGMDVQGIQGFNTVVEAGTGSIRTTAILIAEHNIPAIFVESTVSPKMVHALQEAVAARGLSVAIGGELFSDSAGNKGTIEGTYLGMYYHNVDTIVAALKSEKGGN